MTFFLKIALSVGLGVFLNQSLQGSNLHAVQETSEKDSQKKAVLISKEKLRKIQSRQNDDHLKIYLKGSKRMYVNGTQISQALLKDLIGQTRLKLAIISSSPEVLPERVNELQKWLRRNGIKKVTKSGTAAKPLKIGELAQISRDESQQRQKAKLKKIVDRQTKSRLNVYVGRIGAFVNGQSISREDIEPIKKATGLKVAIISFDRDAKEKAAEWDQRLRKAGMKTKRIELKEKANNTKNEKRRTR